MRRFLRWLAGPLCYVVFVNHDVYLKPVVEEDLPWTIGLCRRCAYEDRALMSAWEEDFWSRHFARKEALAIMLRDTA